MIRIFISSTFEEFERERNLLETEVFPELDNLCRANAFSFQVIDLRWGVSRQAALDNQTVQICFDEIERCQRLSPRPNFLVMAGSRYGWRPLPSYIPKKEWVLLTRQISPQQYRLLGEWYVLDENDLMERYFLRPRTGIYLEEETWRQTESRLRDCLFPLAAERLTGEEELRKYGLSATEQEIYRGLFDSEEAKEHTFVMLKDGYETAQSGGDTASARCLQDRLRKELSGREKQQICEYREGETTYLAMVRDFLTDMIRRELAKAGHPDAWQDEQETLEDALREVNLSYIARPGLDGAFDTFCEKNRGRAVLVTGQSGAGKSYFLKHWVFEHKEQAVGFFPDAQPMRRGVLDAFSFCLKGLQQKGLLDGVEPAPSYVESEEWLLEHFNRIGRPQTAGMGAGKKSGQPVTVILDAVDTIADWHRLPFDLFAEKLPDQVTLVVSCIDRSDLGADAHLSQIPCFAVPGMPEEDAMSMLTSRLRQKKRRLTDGQSGMLRRKLPADCTPLYIEILSDFCRKWKSQDQESPGAALPPEMFVSQEKMVRSWLEHLGSGGYPVLHRHALAYLALAADGLTETEMLALLTRDPEVIGEVRSENRKTSKREWTFQAIPPVLWARLFYEISENLSELYQNGNLLMRFRHQHFSGQVFAMMGEEMPVLAKRMRDYFASLPWNTVSDGGEVTANLRKIRELYHLNDFLGDTARMQQLLSEPLYVDGCIRCGLYREVVTQISEFTDQSPYNMPWLLRTRYLLWEKARLLQTFPDSYLQSAAEAHLAGDGELKTVRKSCHFVSENRQGGIVTMEVAGNSFAVSRDKILAAVSGGVIRLYDMKTHVALDAVCKTLTDMGELYWQGEELVYRTGYFRFHFRYLQGQLRETFREECPDMTHLLDADGAALREAGGLAEKARIFTEARISGGRIQYVDPADNREKEISLPLDARKSPVLSVYGQLLAILTDGSVLLVYDLNRKLIVAEYEYLMIERIRWSESGEDLLLILTNGRVALVPSRGSGVERPLHDEGRDRTILDGLLAADSVSIIFNEFSPSRKGDYPVQHTITSNRVRAPLYAAFSRTEGWMACYYYYAGESIVRVFDMEEDQKPRTYLADPIYQQDSVGNPFYASEDGKSLILVSFGREHVLDVASGVWHTGDRAGRRQSSGGISEKIVSEYAASVREWMPKTGKTRDIDPKNKSIRDRMMDLLVRALEIPFGWLMGIRNKSYINGQLNAELAEERLLALPVRTQGDLYWLVDPEHGLIQVFDRDGNCLCREQRKERILSYELDDLALTILEEGTFAFEKIRLRWVGEKGKN